MHWNSKEVLKPTATAIATASSIISGNLRISRFIVAFVIVERLVGKFLELMLELDSAES